MTTNDYQWLPMTTDDYRKDYQKTIKKTIKKTIQWLSDPQVSHSLKLFPNECVDFDEPKEFDDTQVFDNP